MCVACGVLFVVEIAFVCCLLCVVCCCLLLVARSIVACLFLLLLCFVRCRCLMCVVDRS